MRFTGDNVEAAVPQIRIELEEVAADDLRRGASGVAFEPSVPAGDDQAVVGREDALFGRMFRVFTEARRKHNRVAADRWILARPGTTPEKIAEGAGRCGITGLGDQHHWPAVAGDNCLIVSRTW